MWLPCKKEITRITKRRRTYPFEYMCADDKWGSLTLQSVIQDMKDGVRAAWDHRGKVRTEGRALVACSLDCGKALREIATIQEKHDYVLLASHDRLLPDADRSRDFTRGCEMPERYLLLSEIARRDASRHGNSRLHDTRAVSGA